MKAVFGILLIMADSEFKDFTSSQKSEIAECQDLGLVLDNIGDHNEITVSYNPPCP
jgi:hypothetical protein